MERPKQSAADLFGELVRLPSDQWTGYLDRTCAGAPELRRQLEALLQEHQRLGRSQATLASGSRQSLSDTALGAPLSSLPRLPASVCLPALAIEC